MAADICAFCKKGVIILCHVDNCSLLAQARKLSDELFTTSQEDFLCADEDEADVHHGVKIKKNDGALTLKRSQLIKRTIELVGLTDYNLRSMPVTKLLLGKNSEGRRQLPFQLGNRPFSMLDWLHKTRNANGCSSSG